MSAAPNGSTTIPASTDLYVRLAREDELDILADLAADAFTNDAMPHYFGGLKTVSTPQLLRPQASLLGLAADEPADSRTWRTYRAFQNHLNRECFAVGARITVLALPADGQAKERIVAMTIWLPPYKRMAGTEEDGLRTGIGSVIEGWGRGWVQREKAYHEGSNAAISDALAGRGVKSGPLGIWYLQFACTRPGYQGKGFLSRLMREMHASVPDAIIALDSTSAKSRAAYQHLGFELVKTSRIGQSEVDSRGLLASGEEATGFELYTMVKWPALAGRIDRGR